VFTTVWGTYSNALSRVGMPSFKVARKTFSTTARRIRIDEGYVRTMLGQKDKSISISYIDYDDPIASTQNIPIKEVILTV